MNALVLSKGEKTFLIGVAIFGLIVPNGVFIYFFVADPVTVRVALNNPISLVFIAEAFFLMALFAWFINRLGIRRPNGRIFVVMSLLGSMVFSVPMTIYLALKNRDSK